MDVLGHEILMFSRRHFFQIPPHEAQHRWLRYSHRDVIIFYLFIFILRFGSNVIFLV